MVAVLRWGVLRCNCEQPPSSIDTRSSIFHQEVRTWCSFKQKSLSQLHPKGEYPCNCESDLRGIPYSQWNEGGNRRRGWYCCTLIGVLRMAVGVVEVPPTASEIGEARFGLFGMISDGSQADRFVGT